MKTLWVIYDQQKVGTFKQCLSIASWLGEEFNFKVVSKPIQLGLPYRWFPPQLMRGVSYEKLLPRMLSKAESSTTNAPCYPVLVPDLVIAGGRQAINVALTLRKFTKTIVLQNPKINPGVFDLVICPYHDNLRGNNVIETIGVLHPIRPQELEKLRNLNSKTAVITVLIGGDSKHYKFTTAYIKQLAAHLHNLVKNPEKGKDLKGAHLCLSPSRRSNPELMQILQQNLQGLSFTMWGGVGANPYLDYLAQADALVVTGDSVSMMSEACITGKPVYIHEIPQTNKKLLGRTKPSRINNFINSIYGGGFAANLANYDPHKNPFEISTENSTKNSTGPRRLDELARIKPIIKQILEL